MPLTLLHEFTIHFALLWSSMGLGGTTSDAACKYKSSLSMRKFTAASFIDCKKNYTHIRKEELKLSASATINHTVKYLGK